MREQCNHNEQHFEKYTQVKSIIMRAVCFTLGEGVGRTTAKDCQTDRQTDRRKKERKKERKNIELQCKERKKATDVQGYTLSKSMRPRRTVPVNSPHFPASIMSPRTAAMFYQHHLFETVTHVKHHQTTAVSNVLSREAA